MDDLGVPIGGAFDWYDAEDLTGLVQGMFRFED